MGEFPSSLAWTKEETVLLLGERRKESLYLNFLYHPASFSDLSSTSKRFEVIEGRDQIRSAIRSRLHELALLQRADRFESFMWTIHIGRILMRLQTTKEDFKIYILNHNVWLSMLRYWVWNSRSGRLDLLLNAIFWITCLSF